jgi:hypothetical protein
VSEKLKLQCHVETTGSRASGAFRHRDRSLNQLRIYRQHEVNLVRAIPKSSSFSKLRLEFRIFFNKSPDALGRDFMQPGNHPAEIDALIVQSSLGPMFSFLAEEACPDYSTENPQVFELRPCRPRQHPFVRGVFRDQHIGIVALLCVAARKRKHPGCAPVQPLDRSG